MYRISVIIPVYNVEKYIVGCLESVVAQKREDIDIECLLIDDCSPDNSFEVAQTYISNYHGAVRFEMFRHETNKGQAAARNLGLRKATGDYVFFLDSDDHLFPDSFQKMADALKKMPGADFVEGYYHSQKENKVYPGRMAYQEYTDRNNLLKKFYAGRLSHLACNKLVKRQVIIDNSLFFIEGIIYEDIQWTHKFFHYISSAIIIPEVTYEYEYNPTSTSNIPHLKATKSILSFATVLDSFLDMQEDKLYVDHKLYVFHYMLNALDIQSKGSANDEAKARLSAVKKRLFLQTLRNGRIILLLYFMLMYKPFYYLLSFSFFRRQIHWMEKGVSLIARKMDWIHHIF